MISCNALCAPKHLTMSMCNIYSGCQVGFVFRMVRVKVSTYFVVIKLTLPGGINVFRREFRYLFSTPLLMTPASAIILRHRKYNIPGASQDFWREFVASCGQWLTAHAIYIYLYKVDEAYFVPVFIDVSLNVWQSNVLEGVWSRK